MSSQGPAFELEVMLLFFLLQDHDGADDLIGAERMHLQNIKKMLETQLHLVQEQLQVSVVNTCVRSSVLLSFDV